MTVRVRFAPSPTGWLHIGGARTALYNFLFAKKHSGKFILRIEDTDQSRSTDEAIKAILEDMRWLGLQWDEGPEIGGPYGPYRQTERSHLYEEAIKQLLSSGSAYYCFCSPEELEKMREDALSRKLSFRYPRKCRNISLEEAEERIRRGEPAAVRFKTPLEGRIKINDIVRGEVEFDLSQLDDFVIARSDKSPTYNLAVVVDDALMKITHVIRGDDHLSNTPKQVLIYRALGYPVPEFAHLSMILGPDKKPLSKRHGSTAVFEFKNKGYLPEAMVNYLALLGWSFDDKTTFFTPQELIEKFDLSRVSANPAVFDFQKLEWLNGVWIRQLDTKELAKRIEPYVKSDYGENFEIDENFYKLVELTKERMKTLRDFVDWTYFYFIEENEFSIDEKDLKKVAASSGFKDILKEARDELSALSNWDRSEIEKALRELVARLEEKPKKVFQAVRVAVTGRLVSPPLFESLEILGKERTLRRLEKAVLFL
ncbi:MAG: glutamate--tRNA ligase [Actinobacteria bacterium]|nr:glutamate--tRNA ligase [Actinomycetota bacterium]